MNPDDPTTRPMRRFTVSLPESEYESLRGLVEAHQPRLTMNYAVQFAVRQLLDRSGDRQLPLGFGDPVAPITGERR